LYCPVFSKKRQVMEKIHFILVCVISFFFLCSCNKDDEYEEANSQPEFSEGLGDNPRDANRQVYTDPNGDKIIRDPFGCITYISFFGNDNAPSSASEMFNQYMEIDLEENFRLYRSEVFNFVENPPSIECYQQQYKGLIVYKGEYDVHFKSGKVTEAGGTFIKIDNLDVVPTIDEKKAKEIYAKYLRVSAENIGTGILFDFDDALMIAEFPLYKGSVQWAPRLVYGLMFKGESAEGYCFIDAHTGRILQTWPHYFMWCDV